MVAVMSLNLRFGLADDGKNGWRYRKKALPPLFEQFPADFIGMQEVNDFQADDLCRILPGYGAIGSRLPAPDFWQNNIIFHRTEWACIHKDHFFLSPTPEIPSRSRASRWPRQCTIGVFEKHRHRMICVNTHLDFDPEVQRQSAEAIMLRLTALPDHLPAVVVGDFNTTPESECHRVFTGGGRLDAAHPPYFRNAFSPPFPGTHHGFTGSTSGDCIDWILCRGPIRPETVAVVRKKFSGVFPSDHFPVYAKFSKKEANGGNGRFTR